MQSRVAVAKIIRDTLDYKRQCLREKNRRVHYGKQDLRELMDFIYDGKPQSEDEKIFGGHIDSDGWLIRYN